MAPEPTPTLAPPPPGGPTPPADKVRIRFRKHGALRMLSHHDLMRCFERMLRRAALPVRQTKGFHPKPRLVFALSLPLGVVGCEEVVELELDDMLPEDEVRERLASQAPPGLQILRLCRIDHRTTARIHSLTYRIAIPAERAAAAARNAADVLAGAENWVERARPTPRRVNLRPWILSLRVNEQMVSRDAAAERAGQGAPPHVAANQHALLEMKLCLTPAGTARPEEVLAVLGLTDLLEAGAVLERSRLELVDEIPPPTAEGNA